MSAKDERLTELNKRVRLAAKQLPTKGLQLSYKAFGYRASVETMTDSGCEIRGMSMRDIEYHSRRNGYGRSKRQLWRDLATLEDLGLAYRVSTTKDGKNGPDTIRLRFAPLPVVPDTKHPEDCTCDDCWVAREWD